MADGRDWTVYDRPDLRTTLGPRSGDSYEALVSLDGMHCAGCVARAERALAGQAEEVRVNLTARTVSFRWRPRLSPLSSILRRLDEAGLEPRVLAHEDDIAADAAARRQALARIGVATICAMQVMMLAWPSYFHAHPEPGIVQLLRWAQWAIATPGVLWAGWPFFANAAVALRGRTLNMDVPVALALAVAYGASAVRTVAGSGDLYFDTATMFVWFLAIGRFLESRTRAVAGARLRILAGRRALTAQRRSTGGLETVPIGALAVGDEIVVPMGEAAPADGTLLDAQAQFDESLVTGESRAVLRTTGQPILAGSLNLGDAPVAFRATRTGADTTLAQITRLLGGAQAQKPKIQLLADFVAGHFIVGVLLLAAAGAIYALPRGSDAALNVALSVLVASCPCALSLAVPAALAAATSRLAGSGVLVASAEAFARLPHVDTVLFDKTGTLTQPQMSVQRVITLADLDEAHCLALAAALERGTRHPIAQAFESHATAAPAAIPKAEGLRSHAGTGVSGTIDGHYYWLGAMERAPIAMTMPDGDADVLASSTWIALTDRERPLALIALAAAPRAEAPAVIAELTRRGIQVELLSGDSVEATTALARHLGIARYSGRQTPADKLARLRALQKSGATVLAVGDGLNDAPLLAAADVSAALPRGAALTQSRADLLLLGDTLSGLTLANDVSRRAQRRMRENLLWALVYNLAVLPLAITGGLQPWMAAAGMSVSSLLVVANALRLGKIRRTTEPSSTLQAAGAL
jgi:Cu2+-exporting ATPase